ncbi:hypothetical protein HanRHA438_Chr09g0378531 [Helianthus annuus]|nr:hypothetical protein HanRHA438_Chr09g0378531 [Helianthus annuus]
MMDGSCDLSKFWIWSLAFQMYTDDPCSLHFVTDLVPPTLHLSKVHAWSLWFIQTKVPFRSRARL